MLEGRRINSDQLGKFGNRIGLIDKAFLLQGIDWRQGITLRIIPDGGIVYLKADCARLGQTGITKGFVVDRLVYKPLAFLIDDDGAACRSVQNCTRHGRRLPHNIFQTD